jgi:hypothetical protein
MAKKYFGSFLENDWSREVRPNGQKLISGRKFHLKNTSHLKWPLGALPAAKWRKLIFGQGFH